MRSNKEIFNTMKEKVETAWYMYYRAKWHMDNATNEVDKAKWEKRMEKRGKSAESMTWDYNDLLRALEINTILDQFQIQTEQLILVQEMYKEEEAV